MVPEYVQKTLDLLGLTEFAAYPVVVGPEGDRVTGTMYEIAKELYIYRVYIWDQGVHEFIVSNRSEIIFYQCDLGLERDYQAFEEFVKDLV